MIETLRFLLGIHTLRIILVHPKILDYSEDAFRGIEAPVWVIVTDLVEDIEVIDTGIPTKRKKIRE